VHGLPGLFRRLFFSFVIELAVGGGLVVECRLLPFFSGYNLALSTFILLQVVDGN
jgi:hypothetical protein